MIINVDDWRFKTESEQGSAVAVELFLTNGQRARLEVFPLINPNSSDDQIPELVVVGEAPGEELHASPPRRWITRAPHRQSKWSQVELSETLIRQINDRLAQASSQELVATY
jgi:hypothetical protein